MGVTPTHRILQADYCHLLVLTVVLVVVLILPWCFKRPFVTVHESYRGSLMGVGCVVVWY